jgi:hypothetical protein
LAPGEGRTHKLVRAPAPADLSRGVGPAGQHPHYPGLASERDISENNQRLFCRRWEEGAIVPGINVLLDNNLSIFL